MLRFPDVSAVRRLKVNILLSISESIKSQGADQVLLKRRRRICRHRVGRRTSSWENTQGETSFYARLRRFQPGIDPAVTDQRSLSCPIMMVGTDGQAFLPLVACHHQESSSWHPTTYSSALTNRKTACPPPIGWECALWCADVNKTCF